MANLSNRAAPKGRLATEQIPKGRAQRINVRARVEQGLARAELLRAGEVGCAGKSNASLLVVSQSHDDRLGQTEIDHFDNQCIRVVGIVTDDHQIAGLEIPMHQPMRLSRDEGAGHLDGYLQGKIRRNEAITANICLDGFAFNQFHRIETPASVGFAKMKDTSDIRVPQCGRARLATKPLARFRVFRVAGGYDRERNKPSQSKVLGTVSISHRSAAELVKSNSILAAANLIVLKATIEPIKPAFEKATWAASFWCIGWDFRAALRANSHYTDHGYFSWQSFRKRGSFRTGSNMGSSRRSTGVSGTPNESEPEYGVESTFCKAAMARSGSPMRAATRARISIGMGPVTESFSTGFAAIAART